MKSAIRTMCEPPARDSHRCAIETAPLRTWSEVAANVPDVIAERRTASAALAVRPYWPAEDAA